MYNATSDTIGRVNRLLSAWPVDDDLPAEGFDSVRNTYKKLTSGLTEIKTSARAIDDVVERLGILIALRKASEAVPPGWSLLSS